MGVRWAIAATVLAALLIAGWGADGADLRGEMRYGFDGVARPEYWSPVTVDLSNAGPERRGVLVVTNLDRRLGPSQRRGCTVVLPQGSRQRHVVFWQSGWPSAASGTAPGALFAGYVVREPPVTYVDDTETLVVAVGFPPGTFGYLARVERVRLTQGFQGAMYYRRGAHPGAPSNKGRIVPAHVPPRHLPESAQAYFQTDLVILGPIFASDLSPQAKAAFLAWVRTGGNLAIVGGADAARLNDPFFQELLPVEGLTASATPIPTALRKMGIAVSEPAAVTVGVPKPAASVMAQESGVPLVVKGRVGLGAVTFVAFDPSRAPLAGAMGLEKLWLSLLDDRARIYSLQDQVARPPSHYQGNMLGSAMYDAVTGLKQVQAPPLIIIGSFLGLYFLVLIPINHWVLARRKRRELAWVTTPIVVALFFAAAYGLGYSLKGPALLLNQRTVMQASEGSPQALGLSLFGIFSPARRDYDIHVGLRDGIVSETGWADYYGRYGGPGGGSFRPGPDSGIVHDEADPWVEGARINMWGMKVFAANGIVDMKGAVRSDITTSGRDISGWIENGTRWTLKRAGVVAPGTPQSQGGPGPGRPAAGASILPEAYLGDIAPGAKVDIASARMTAGPPRMWSPSPQDQQIPWLAVASLLPPQRQPTQVALVCDVEPSPAPVEVGLRCQRQERTLLVVRLPLTWAAGRVRLRPGAYSVVSDRGHTAWPMRLDRDPDIVYTFTPPAGFANLRVDEISIGGALQGQGHAPPYCEVALYDNRSHAWRKVSPAASGARAAGGRGTQWPTVAQAGRYVARDGTIRVRLTRCAGVQRVEVHALDIGVEGER
jgi:hypothetical protein